MGSSVKDVLGQDDVFKNAEKLWEAAGELVNANSSIEIDGDANVYNSFPLGLGLSFLLVGTLGLYFKITERYAKLASKFVKSSISIWCCLIGIFLITSEIDFGYGGLNMSVKNLISLAIDVSVFALKNHTIIVFSFQNVLIYYPFYFEECKKNFARWLIRITSCQWAISFCVPLIGAMIFIFSGLNDCSLIISVTFIWQCTLQGILIFGYLGAFILSITYMIGFYKANKTNISSTATASRAKTIKQTMVACSVEVVCDLAALAYHIFFASTCSLKLKKLDSGRVNSHVSRNLCDTSMKITWLNSGVPACVLWMMLVQQLLQEMVFVFAVVTDRRQK